MKKKKSLIFSCAIIYFFILFLFIGVRLITYNITFPVSDEVYDIVATSIIQIGILFLFPLILISIFQKQSPKKTFQLFGFGKISFLAIIYSFAIGFLCYFLNLSIASFFSGLIRAFGYEQAPTLTETTKAYPIWLFFLNVLSVAILPAICEEITHRGLLLKGFYGLGIKRALIISSLLFGLLHLNINQFFYASILGLIIGGSAIISKNILPAIIIHFMNNFLSVFFNFSNANNLFGKDIYSYYLSFVYSGDMFSVFVKNCLMLFTLFFGIMTLFSLLLRETRIKKVNNMLKEIVEINRQYMGTSGVGTNFNNAYYLNAFMTQYNIKSLNSMIFSESEIKGKNPTAFEGAIIFSCFVIGTLITAFTFIWGVL